MSKGAAMCAVRSAAANAPGSASREFASVFFDMMAGAKRDVKRRMRDASARAPQLLEGTAASAEQRGRDDDNEY